MIDNAAASGSVLIFIAVSPQCYCYVCDSEASQCKYWGTGEGLSDIAAWTLNQAQHSGALEGPLSTATCTMLSMFIPAA